MVKLIKLTKGHVPPLNVPGQKAAIYLAAPKGSASAPFEPDPDKGLGPEVLGHLRRRDLAVVPA